MPTYLHKYEDGREVKAKMYPAKYLPAFQIMLLKAGRYLAGYHFCFNFSAVFVFMKISRHALSIYTLLFKPIKETCTFRYLWEPFYLAVCTNVTPAAR